MGDLLIHSNLQHYVGLNTYLIHHTPFEKNNLVQKCVVRMILDIH